MVQVKRKHAYAPKDIFDFCTYEGKNISLPYRMYIPKNYDCGEMYPLVVFLHGAGERGDDNRIQVERPGQMDLIFADYESPIYDSIVIAPQCPAGHRWVNTPWEDGNYSADDIPESDELKAVMKLIDECCREYNVDRDRIYIMGISMGGFGTWDMIMRHGERFACAMPVCGGGDPSYANKLKNIPIRTFHGSRDEAVPVASTREMFAAIAKVGGKNISYTEYDDRGHCVWDEVFPDTDNFRWMFEQNLAERRKKYEKVKKAKRFAIASGAVGALVSIAAFVLSKKGKK